MSQSHAADKSQRNNTTSLKHAGVVRKVRKRTLQSAAAECFSSICCDASEIKGCYRQPPKCLLIKQSIPFFHKMKVSTVTLKTPCITVTGPSRTEFHYLKEHLCRKWIINSNIIVLFDLFLLRLSSYVPGLIKRRPCVSREGTLTKLPFSFKTTM